MAKRSQHDSGEERVTAKSRPMMNLIARAPSHASSSTSVSLVKRGYGNQDPWSSIAKKEERSGRPDIGTTIIMNNLWKASLQQATQSVKSIPPNTENWLRKRYNENYNNDKSNDPKHET